MVIIVFLSHYRLKNVQQNFRYSGFAIAFFTEEKIVFAWYALRMQQI